jgi:hypothetical protein
MAVRYPIEYELTPKSIESGRRWLTLRVKNIGSEDLTTLDVRLNSLDAYNLSTLGTGSYISLLRPDEEQVLPFQISANATTRVYISIDGLRDGTVFHWESPNIPVIIDQESTDLVSLFAMTEPYPLLNEKIKVEATLRGEAANDGFTLEFWADTPSGEFEKLGVVETPALDIGEEARFSAEIQPDEEGLYTIYGYLYDGVKRIGRAIEHVTVTKAA